MKTVIYSNTNTYLEMLSFALRKIAELDERPFDKLKDYLVSNRLVFFEENFRQNLLEKQKKGDFLAKLLIKKITDASLSVDTGLYKEVQNIMVGTIMIPKETEDEIEELFPEKLDFSNISDKIDSLFSNKTFTNNIGGDSELLKWQRLKRYVSPSRNVLIVDNYFLHTSKKVIEENISGILSVFLPNSISTNTFNLDIFTLFNKNESFDQKSIYESLIKRCFDKFNKLYQISLKIHFINKATNHDRNIYSDYHKISSGHSFHLFEDKKPKNKTTITVSSILNKDDFSIYCNCINNLIKGSNSVEHIKRVLPSNPC